MGHWPTYHNTICRNPVPENEISDLTAGIDGKLVAGISPRSVKCALASISGSSSFLYFSSRSLRRATYKENANIAYKCGWIITKKLKRKNQAHLDISDIRF
jgi:hypothetical protein